MADTAFQKQYRQEYIAGFEQAQSLVRDTVTTEAQIKGNEAVFLVASSGGNRATSRGTNGLITATTDTLTQNTATLLEKHDLRRRTSFNIFASQGEGRKIMQDMSMKVINKEIDYDIITELETGTQDTGSAGQIMSLSLAMYAATILGNNEVPMDGNITCLITPAAYAYLMQTREFASVDYVNNKPFTNTGLTAFRWAGINWIVHPNLTGKGTSTEKCLMYHRNAIGQAINISGLDATAGYNEEQDYSWARTSCFMGSKLLQNSGVVVIYHDGSAFAAQ